MVGNHWSAEVSSYRPDKSYKDRICLVYDATPNGRVNDDGSVSYSMRIPALLVTDWVADRPKVGADIARELNAFPDMLAALHDSVKQLDTIIADGTPTDWQSWRDSLDAAIAKAEGR